MAENIYEMLHDAQSMVRVDAAEFFGVEPAIVTNFRDPRRRGRVKVCYPRLPGNPESDWAPMLRPGAGAGRGFYWVPKVGDEVLVAFERGNGGRPYVIGTLWNGKDKPMREGPTDDNSTILIQTPSGHQIELCDKPGEEKIVIIDCTGNRSVTFDVAAKQLVIETLDGDIIIDADEKIQMRCEELVVKTSKRCKIKIGESFTLKAAGKASIKAGPELVLEAKRIDFN